MGCISLGAIDRIMHNKHFTHSDRLRSFPPTPSSTLFVRRLIGVVGWRPSTTECATAAIAVAASPGNPDTDHASSSGCCTAPSRCGKWESLRASGSKAFRVSTSIVVGRAVHEYTESKPFSDRNGRGICCWGGLEPCLE